MVIIIMNILFAYWCVTAIIVSAFGAQIYDADISSKCVENCYKNHTDFGDICAYKTECHEQCENGCYTWRESLNTSCQLVCNSTNGSLTPHQIYCLIGCNDGVSIFRGKMQSHLGLPPPPVLVADSLTSTSLRLEWNYDKAEMPGLKFLIQWRYEEMQSTWQFYKRTNWMPKDIFFTVDNLQPYTKYRFRVAILIYQLNEPIFSAPSVVMMTLPQGAPMSPPASVRAVPVDCTRISVSWTPGSFPNGPILSYVVRLIDLETNISAFKDVPAERTSDIISSLRPGSRYNVSVRLTNIDGTGPAAFASVTTPLETTVKDIQGPVLIIGTDKEIVEQGVEITDEPIILYNNTEENVTIKGVAIHVREKLLFISDSTRHIYKMPLNKSANLQKIAIISPNQTSVQPLDLSVDWLNKQLYILVEKKFKLNSSISNIWSIMRCDFNGQGLTVAVGGLQIKPHHIEVDPYNGYLFWIFDDNRSRSNLFKLDLSDISNGIKHENHPELIFSEKNLGAFIVDHTNFKLLVSNQNKKTVNSVSLDGNEIQDVRPKISNSILEKVISLATANKKFYWTDGSQVFYEEYHAADEIYFQNSFGALMKASYLKVIINMPSSQPVPVPVNPPTQVQAIFGNNRAKIAWKIPHLLGGQGKGAWQSWLYEISVKDLKNNDVKIYQNITGTCFTISNLSQDTDYVIKAAAYTCSGKGPWSTEFKGRTLKRYKNLNNPIILWSTSNGLSKSDVIGENMETLIDKTEMKNFNFIGSSWFRDEIYLLTNLSEVYIYNLTSHQKRILPKLDNDVKSIAIDWIGKRLYWSKQQWIMRANLTGGSKEPPIAATANELVIDSLRAYLYWSTGYAITCSRLNGDNQLIHYYIDREFSGKRVMGLTLDIENKFVYWIVRGSDGANLFKGALAGTIIDNEPNSMISSIQKPDVKGYLSYFNNRFLWQQDDDNAVISNLEGKNIAVLNAESFTDLHMISVLDPASRKISNHINVTLENINVIPDIVDKDSLKVVGDWKFFNITWKPVDNVNYGSVFYEVKFSDRDATIVHQPSINYPYSVDPYSKIQISIRSCTDWTSAPQIIASIRSPSSPPEEPQNLRSFVTYKKQYDLITNITITIRWDEPINPNGDIKKYKVSHWVFRNETFQNIWEGDTPPDNKEYILNNVTDEVVLFKILAYTVSEGSPATIQVNTSIENPIPTLISSGDDSIYIQDLDSNKSKDLLYGISAPLDIGVLMSESKLFWLNDMQELFVYNMETKTKNKILDIGDNVVSLTVDWLERSLYFVQFKGEKEGSFLYKLDLNLVEKNILKLEFLFKRPTVISKLEISPFTRKMYWIENDQNDKYVLMESDGQTINHFFNKQQNQCNCPLRLPLDKTFTIDHSEDKTNPKFIFVESSNVIIAADKFGCNCESITTLNVSDTSSLKSEFNNLYLLDRFNKDLYIFNKRSKRTMLEHQSKAKEMLIFGDHVQPYPSKKCLQPNFEFGLSPNLANRTWNSLTLTIPEIKAKDEECKGISMATIEYKLFYKESGNQNYTVLSTFDKVVTINNLKPYTKYSVSLGARNYYSDKEKDFKGIWNVFQTAVGAPSEPRNVTVTVLNPTLLKVSWLPPEEFNGDTIYYEIHWLTETTTSGIRKKGEQIVMENDVSVGQEPFTTNLQKMSQNETYMIWVRAYSQNNDSSNESQTIKITTFPEPENLTLSNCSAYDLQLNWKISEYIENYVIQYTLLISNDWQQVLDEWIENDSLNNETVVSIDINNLKPKTQYKFRFLLRYPEDDGKDYIWPDDGRFVFETKGDRPTPPGKPEYRSINGGNESKIWWQPSKDNGGPIELYKLEGLKMKNYREKRSTNRSAWSYSAPSIEETEFEWKEFYNGSETFWKIDGLTEDYRYSFRALALNEYGWSEPSEEMEFDPTTAALLAEKPDPLTMILIAICTPIVILILVTCLCMLCFVLTGRWDCSKNKKDAHIIVPISRRPDVELATLRELPRRSNFIQNTNVLYVSAQPTPDEIKLLPHIRRDQISLTKFLGSGAFGEVYEGKARGISENAETKVAVKTLRKGASEQEKTEFLQEAQLMSHFKHKHILQLLGVCLDNDPHYIIMELMEGGDLLTYLRASRNTSALRTPPLTLVELLKMCLDVTTGCRYLEEMHFVHRDLACRNCLVSSTDSASRIVKIGDFGLARDIYKNDYYRKEGEGLLPVRWMAPESLVDGVFTSQSDVWSFGVLLWEIMTLGQQPYPARNNLEVLHYVRRGGRLGKPTDCPEKLHDLMLLCWSFEPEGRPTFKYCLDTLTKLHEQVLRCPVTSAHTGQYISTIPDQPDGVTNQLYFQDYNHNHSGTSWKSDDSSREITPFLNSDQSTPAGNETSNGIPKYLEIVYDANAEDNDGYEIPRKDVVDGQVEEIIANG
ncbi:proto-oncogene tyrosine-protein kinase ROS isoform X1 [Onthophagus taurus]|uniref:proto-oncogene tyrosine-protein kinase ROS isoform X1 n=1 Tax=Onthophagus taurus TaxID=166361 RepID=UPI0039BDDB0C